MSGFESFITPQLEALVQSGVAGALGRTLLHSLWEGAAVALALAIVLSIARSPRVRYAAACAAMVAMLAGIVITFVRLAPAPPVTIRLAGNHVSHIPARPITLALNPTTGSIQIDELAWLAPLWLAGVLIFQLRGVTSWMAARRLGRTGVCCAPALWQVQLDRLGERMRVTRPVVLLESCLAEVPVVIGYLRPIVLMPVGLLAGLPTGQVEAILLHELAHIRRYDYLVNLLQVFVEGLLFYHPAVWLVSGVMRTERENCCDDMVVSAVGGALEYATALTVLERRRVNQGTALAATDGSLVNRVQRLLGRSARLDTGVMPRLTAAILTICVVTAMAILQMGPVLASVTAPRMLLDAKVAAAAAARPAGPAQKAKASAPAMPAILAEPAVSAIPAVPATPAVMAQTVTKPLNAEQQRGKEDALHQELLTPYRKWLLEDVVYIISDEERRAFQQLNTDEEREKFVEQFWARRDPTPGTEQNEMKQEHYRRIAYVNEHYADGAGLAGWRTDRGRIYIQYGPPDQIEAHPSGGTYQRPVGQGGGVTETFPFEQWMYRYIDGVGRNLILEFVDTSRNGEYRMTMDPSEKDALLHPVPIAPVAPGR